MAAPRHRLDMGPVESVAKTIEDQATVEQPLERIGAVEVAIEIERGDGEAVLVAGHAASPPLGRDPVSARENQIGVQTEARRPLVDGAVDIDEKRPVRLENRREARLRQNTPCACRLRVDACDITTICKTFCEPR